MKYTTQERTAMGIVNQIFDYLIEEGIEISVDFRQKHNDKLSKYVLGFLQEGEMTPQDWQNCLDGVDILAKGLERKLSPYHQYVSSAKRTRNIVNYKLSKLLEEENESKKKN